MKEKIIIHVALDICVRFINSVYKYIVFDVTYVNSSYMHVYSLYLYNPKTENLKKKN